VPPYQKGGLGVFVRGITNKFDRRMTILALDLLLEMRAVSPGMLAIAGGLLVWNLGIRGGQLLSQRTTYSAFCGEPVCPRSPRSR
jgi:hypothetical protein